MSKNKDILDIIFKSADPFTNVEVSRKNDDLPVLFAEGSGTTRTEIHSLPVCEGFILGLPATVELVQAAQSSMHIEADENLLPLISTEIDRHTGLLLISVIPGTAIRTTSKIKIRLSMPVIKTIRLDAGGNVIARQPINTTHLSLKIGGIGYIGLTANTTTLEATISGSGVMILKGHTITQVLSIQGKGNIYTDELQSSMASIYVKGKGDCMVQVKDRLDVHVSGKSNIGYKGNPLLVKNITGEGFVAEAVSKKGIKDVICRWFNWF